jgi:hypothetical protein
VYRAKPWAFARIVPKLGVVAAFTVAPAAKDNDAAPRTLSAMAARRAEKVRRARRRLRLPCRFRDATAPAVLPKWWTMAGSLAALSGL